MSHWQSVPAQPLPVGTFTVNINAHASPGSTFHRLAELADRAFRLVELHEGLDTSDIPVDAKSRFANIAHSAGDSDVEPLPLRALLYQDGPAMQLQQVVIDFERNTAECEGQPNLAIEPEQIEHARDEIKPYLRNAWRRNREKEEVRRSQEQRAWMDFCGRLKSKGILPAEWSLVPDGPHAWKLCPLCETQTTRCNVCHTLLCLDSACAASQVLPFRSCSQHGSKALCLSCLENEEINPLIGQCPDCKLWFCRLEMTWCLGRPIDGSKRPLSGYLHPRRPDSTREHAIRPIRCASCAGGHDLPLCANQDCWSRGGRYTRICESCTSSGGLRCSCEQCWICDDCEASPTVHCLNKCPRCGGVYCTYGCEYIRACTECNRTTPCDDCLEEDWGSFGGAADVGEGLVLKDKCSTYNCRGRICGACLEGVRCAGCSRAFCSSCRRLQSWGSDKRFCASCHRAGKRRKHD